MKLLGWMHRKIRQTSIEPFKDFSIGNSCACLSATTLLNNQQHYSKTSYSTTHSRQPQEECQRSHSEVKTKISDEVFKEESSIMTSGLFDGFLTIGTLGLEPIITEPSTPTFPMPSENVTEKETDVTENELKLINDELEKFLEAEAKDSSARSSRASSITLSGKQIEGVDTKDHADMVVCPLQGYLFGSSIELPDTCTEVKKERTSLEQLFKMNNIACEHSRENFEKGENEAKKTDASFKRTDAMHFMKKMLKKLHSSSRSSTASASGETADSASAKRKLSKVLKKFQKKIHPERSTAEKEFSKPYKYETNNTSSDDFYNKGDLTLQDKDNRRFPHRVMSKENNFNLTHNRHSSNGSTRNNEHWIKTDADYLVLEL